MARAKDGVTARLTAIYSLHLTAFCVFYNFLSMYLLDQGYSAAQAGACLSLCSLASMLAQPLWGALADRQGGQKGVVPLMYLTGAAAVFLIQFLSGSYPLLLALGFVFAATELSTPPLLNAMTIQASRGAGKGERFGFVRGVSSLVYSGFALVYGRLIERAGYWLSFSLHTVCILLLCLLAARLAVPGVSPGARLSRTERKRALGRLLCNRAFVRLMLSVFLIFCGYCVTMDLLSLILADRGGSVGDLGGALFVCAGTEALFTLCARRLTDRVPLTPVLLGAMAFFCLKLALLLFSRSVAGVMLCLLTQGLCLGIYYPVSVIYIDQIVPAEHRNLAQGIHAAMNYGAGSMVGNFLGGAVAQRFGVNAMLALGLGFCAAGTLLFLPALWERRAGSAP